MIDRRNQVLFAIAVALAALWFALHEPVPTSSSGGRLFVELDPPRVARILLERGGGDAGLLERLELRRADSGWVLPDRYDHPAHPWPVDALVAAAAAVRTTDRVAEESGSLSLYGVDLDAVRVSLAGSDGTLLAAFRVGRPGTSERDGTYLTPLSTSSGAVLAGIFAAPRLVVPVPEPGAWFDARLAEIDSGKVAGLELRGRDLGVAVALERTRRGTWQVVGEAGTKVSPLLVEELLASAGSLYFEDVVGDGAAWSRGELGEEALGLALEREDGTTLELVLGSTDGVRRRAARVDDGALGADWIVVLPETSAARLLAVAAQLASIAGASGAIGEDG